MRIHLSPYQPSLSRWAQLWDAIGIGWANWRARRIERRQQAASMPYDFIEGVQP